MYRLRFIAMMLRCLVAPTRPLLSDFTVTFRAIPLIDTDFSRLFTHTYSVYMALCRWHFVFNSEFRNVAIKRGWAPVTTAETMEYKKSVKAFSRVTVKTRLLYWNERRFYLEQTFSVRETIHAVCYPEGLIRGPQGILEPPEVFRTLGVDQPSPEMPPRIRDWLSSRGLKDPACP